MTTKRELPDGGNVSDLRDLLGDKYDDTIRAFVDATADEPDYFGCSCCTSTTEADEGRTGHSWNDDHPSPAARMAAHDGLAAVLPDLLAAAWDEGHWLGKADAALNAVRVDGQYVQSVNPYRQPEGNRA